MAGAALGAPPARSAEVRRRLSIVGAGCFFVAGAALGASPSHFAWQVQHAEHLSLILRGRCSTRSTSRDVRGSPATIEYCGRRLRLRGRRSTWSTSVSFCVAGAIRGAHPERSAEARRRLSTVGAGCVCVAGTALGSTSVSFCVAGAARGTMRNTSREVRGSLATIEYCGHRLRCVCVAPASLGAPQSHFGRSSTWSTSVSFCVAGAARGAHPERSAEVPRRLSTVGTGCVCVAGTALGAPQSHFGRSSTWSTSVSFCVAGAAVGAPEFHLCVAGAAVEASRLRIAVAGEHHQHNTTNTTSSTQLHLHDTVNTTPSTQHHQHNFIYTTPSTQHHQHNTINTTPSKQHHLHNTIYTASSTQHHLH